MYRFRLYTRSTISDLLHYTTSKSPLSSTVCRADRGLSIMVCAENNCEAVLLYSVTL